MKRIFVIIMIFMAMTNIAFAQTANKFEIEKVKSKCEYPKSYTGPKEISLQVLDIAKMFGLDRAQALKYSKQLPELPVGAEGWFAIPKLSAVAKANFPEVTDVDEQYRRALALVFEKIGNSRPYKNYLEEEIPFSNIKQTSRTVEYFKKLEEQQPGDIIIIAAQQGKLHRGESPRFSVESFAQNEFGLNTFALACMALTHPERHSKANKLYVNCIGDEYIAFLKDEYFACPVILFYDNEVELDFNSADDPLARCGAGTGFIPCNPNVVPVTPGM